MRLLLTGASGFIGRACVNLLQQSEYEVHALYHQRPPFQTERIKWHHADILNSTEISQLILKIKPNYLIHLAWFVEPHLFWASPKNLDFMSATLHLYQEFSQRGGKKAIFIGTCAEYEKASVCYENSTHLNPETLYGKCKKETYLELLNCQTLLEGAPFCWARLFHTFGPHEDGSRFIPYIFQSYLRNEIPVIANPLAVRDFLFVECIAEYLIYFLQKETSTVINIGSGQARTLGEIAAEIHQTFFSVQAPPFIKNTSNQEDQLIPDITALNKMQIPIRMTFENGLKKAYCYWSLFSTPSMKEKK